MSIQDGSVEWQKDFIMGLRKLPLVVGYNKKETFTSSGTFTPTMTGLYKITLQGGGGGGGTPATNGRGYVPGGGGGQGGHVEFYEKLMAGTSYSFTIGAGGSSGGAGGASSITLNNNVYECTGGGAGANGDAGGGGAGGVATKNSETISRGECGNCGIPLGYGATAGQAMTNAGGAGGGAGGGNGGASTGAAGIYGGGGAGGAWWQSARAGGTGGDGYITFEWFDPSEAFPDIWTELESE